MNDSSEQTSPEDDRPTAFDLDAEGEQSVELVARRLDNIANDLSEIKSRIESILLEESDQLGRVTQIKAKIALTQTEHMRTIYQSESILSDMESSLKRIVVAIDASRKMLSDATKWLVDL